MFGSGSAVQFDGGRSAGAGITDDDTLNDFVAKVGLSMEVEQQVRQLDMPLRIRVLTVLAAKMQQNNIQNPSTYLAGIIRNEGRASPYQQASWNAVSGGHGGYQSAAAQVALRSIASPQQSPRQLAKPPLWVTEVWPMAQRPQAFMRKMLDVLGNDAMQQIATYSLAVQITLLMSLVLTPAAWPEPGRSFKDLLNLIKELPPMPSAAPLRPLPRSGKPLVILQLGPSIGAEWVCLRSAFENIKPEFADLRIDARHANCVDGNVSSFHGAITKAVSFEGIVETHKDCSSMATAVAQQLPAWKNSDATVVVLVTLPCPDRRTGGPVVGPQWHVKPANTIWDIFSVLRVLSGLPDHRYACLLLEPVPETCAPSPMLDDVFGEAFVISKSKSKTPAARDWRVRSWPPLADGDLTERKIDRSVADAEKFQRALLDMRAGTPADVSLPSPEDIEMYYDCQNVESTQRDNGQVAAFSLLHRPTGHGADAGQPPKMLDRADLARLWGVDGWDIDQAFSRVSPCCGWCSWATGFQAAQSSHDATPCGAGRWCYKCDQWYALLHACPPPHVWTLLEPLLRKSLGKQSAGTAAHFAKLTVHSCDGSGCGCY